MSDSVAILIADAVTAAINGGTWSRKPTAERGYIPIYNLMDNRGLRCVVVPASLEPENGTRAGDDLKVGIDVGVMQKVPDTANATLDPLLGFAEELRDYFQRCRLSGDVDAICSAAKLDPIFVPEHLTQIAQFSSFLHLTFEVAG